MPALDSTVSGEFANTYASLVEAQTYMDERLGTAEWDAASTDDQKRALIQATRVLDANYEWQGVRASSTQALDNPRTGMYSCDTDELLPDDEIPLQIKYAEFEQALYLLKGSAELAEANLAKGIKSARVADLEVEFSNSFAASKISNQADDFINCLGTRVGGKGNGYLRRY